MLYMILYTILYMDVIHYAVHDAIHNAIHIIQLHAAQYAYLHVMITGACMLYLRMLRVYLRVHTCIVGLFPARHYAIHSAIHEKYMVQCLMMDEHKMELTK